MKKYATNEERSEDYKRGYKIGTDKCYGCNNKDIIKFKRSFYKYQSGTDFDKGYHDALNHFLILNG